MKHYCFNFIFFISVIIASCKSNRHLTYKVIRQNYFDSNYYSLSSIDTNKVKAFIYINIFSKVHFDTSAQCLLLNTFNAYVNEYGLYDYRTKKFYYTSASSKNDYQFTEMKYNEQNEMYRKIKEIVDNPDLLYKFIYKKNRLMDGANFEANFITVISVDEVFVKAFHW